MQTAIAAEHLEYAYGRNPVLKDISFAVPKGDFFIIIGPNGSGKTTLLKLLAGIHKPRSGGIEVNGKPLQEYSRKALSRSVAYVPQMIQTDFPFTVREVVLMGRSPHLGMLGLEGKEDIELAEKAMGFTEVRHLANRKLNQLSGGECQRAYIARAICQQTRIILLDEPTASLDLAHQVRIMDLMERLQKEKGITVVMVSHDVNLAAMYGSQVLLLKDGRLLHMGAPGEVMQYATLEDAYGCKLLVDDNPMGGFPRITLVPERFIKSTPTE
jgi:iron complex transport system ATP-binding protein